MYDLTVVVLKTIFYILSGICRKGDETPVHLLSSCGPLRTKRFSVLGCQLLREDELHEEGN